VILVFVCTCSPPTDIVCNNNSSLRLLLHSAELQRENVTTCHCRGQRATDSERINDFLPARLTLRQVIKGNFDVVQSTIELLNHVRPETTFD